MLKVVWISTSRFTSDNIKGTGSWLLPLARELVDSNQVELTHFALCLSSFNFVEEKIFGIIQYVYPNHLECEDVSIDTANSIKERLDNIAPDVVHIWGTESNIASLYTNGYLKYPTFIDIQGFMPSIPDKFMKGLSFLELLKIHLGKREFLHPRISLFYTMNTYIKKSNYSKKLLSSFKYISVQSSWVEAQILALFPKVNILNTGIILREEFYLADKWKNNFNNPIIFSCASSTLIPYKGLYTMLKGLKLIKQRYPNVVLRLAGTPINKNNMVGFERLINDFILKNDLTDNVFFIGQLEATQLISELQNSNVCIIPSYVETYCLALAEAQMIGTPCVASYAGAMPEIAIPNEEALYYEPLDYQMMSFQVCRLLSDKELSNKLSINGIKHRTKANDRKAVANNQMVNYYKVINNIN